MSGSLHLENKDGSGVYVLTFKANENRFNPTFIQELHKALDTIENDRSAVALVTTGEGKFYSNGLDLDWVSAQPDAGQAMQTIVQEWSRLAARFLVFPMPTVAAINGHAFAAGLMLAFAHDYRIMRDDRGFLCMPEVLIHMGLTPGMNSIVNTRINDPNTYRDAVLTGKRFGGKEAQAKGMIDLATCEDKVLPQAIALATKLSPLGKDRTTFSLLKHEMYKRPYGDLMSGKLPSKANL
ncbi:putative EnoylCoA hydratase/isomerase [Balamuthia mandrillaris]